MIPFGEWLPDQPDLNNPGATVAKNVIAVPQGYRPLKAIALQSSNATTDRPRGIGTGISDDGTPYVFVGDETNLYKYEDAAFTDISGATYTTAGTENWEFADYGDLMLGTNFSDNPQKFQMGVDSAFSDLTTAVKARHIAVVRDFVFLGNTWDASDGNVPYRTRWSALGDPTDFTPSVTTQSDWQDNIGGGAVQRIVGGEYGIIFHENSIWRASYVGTPAIFQFDEVEPGRGALVGGAVATRMTNKGRLVFYLDADGFYMFDGNQSHAIGAEKVDRYFFNDLSGGYYDKITSAIDPANNIVYWSYPGSGHVSGKPNRLIMFNYEIGKWSFADVDNDMVGLTRTQGYTLEQIDNITTNVDSLDISLDSRALSGGDFTVCAFNSYKYGTFDGSELDATLETAEFEPIEGQRAFMSELWPYADGGTLSAQIGTRNRPNDSYSWGTEQSQNAVGFCPVSDEGRFHRARVKITGSWDHAVGVRGNPVPTGRA